MARQSWTIFYGTPGIRSKQSLIEWKNEAKKGLRINDFTFQIDKNQKLSRGSAPDPAGGLQLLISRCARCSLELASLAALAWNLSAFPCTQVLNKRIASAHSWKSDTGFTSLYLFYLFIIYFQKWIADCTIIKRISIFTFETKIRKSKLNNLKKKKYTYLELS